MVEPFSSQCERNSSMAVGQSGETAQLRKTEVRSKLLAIHFLPRFRLFRDCRSGEALQSIRGFVRACGILRWVHTQVI